MARDPGPSAYLVEGLTVVAPLRQNLGLGLVLRLAMLGNIALAGVVGASVPLFLRRVGLDLAVASAWSSPPSRTCSGFLLFLGVASASLSLIL